MPVVEYQIMEITDPNDPDYNDAYSSWLEVESPTFESHILNTPRGSLSCIHSQVIDTAVSTRIPFKPDYSYKIDSEALARGYLLHSLSPISQEERLRIPKVKRFNSFQVPYFVIDKGLLFTRNIHHDHDIFIYYVGVLQWRASLICENEGSDRRISGSDTESDHFPHDWKLFTPTGTPLRQFPPHVVSRYMWSLWCDTGMCYWKWRQGSGGMQFKNKRSNSWGIWLLKCENRAPKAIGWVSESVEECSGASGFYHVEEQIDGPEIVQIYVQTISAQIPAREREEITHKAHHFL